MLASRPELSKFTPAVSSDIYRGMKGLFTYSMPAPGNTIVGKTVLELVRLTIL